MPKVRRYSKGCSVRSQQNGQNSRNEVWRAVIEATVTSPTPAPGLDPRSNHHNEYAHAAHDAQASH